MDMHLIGIYIMLLFNSLTGTKLGCGEGGRGACTVMVSSIVNGKVEHRSVNACLAPLCSVDSCAIVTVEGIGSVRSGLHPVQERIAALHGSQCGKSISVSTIIAAMVKHVILVNG